MDIPEDTGRDVAAAADGDHEVGVEGIQDAVGRGLAQLVHLSRSGNVSQVIRCDWWTVHGYCKCACHRTPQTCTWLLSGM